MSAVIYLAAWREDLGDFIIGQSSWTITDPVDALICLIITYFLVWFTSFYSLALGENCFFCHQHNSIGAFFKCFSASVFINLYSGAVISLLMVQFFMFFFLFYFNETGTIRSFTSWLLWIWKFG